MKAISLQRTRYFHIGSICWFKSLLLGGETVHNENMEKSLKYMPLNICDILGIISSDHVLL